MLATVFNDFQEDWDAQLLRIEIFHNSAVNTAAAGLAPNEVHIMGRCVLYLSRFFERAGVR